jgi:hypothetical protein
MKTSTRTSDATRTTTAVHTVLVRVRVPPASADVRGETSVSAPGDDPASVPCFSWSSCNPILRSHYPGGRIHNPAALGRGTESAKVYGWPQKFVVSGS